ncbi:TonB-dependent siderophore receptor [Colwellia echini]|uniref:TonB-dependent siderophore receptor n=1 Tax=Colwellia echini TaxID=1982103 RepID=A0ABY3MU06_9GAMM|nr:TonB-dependent siderophore receptor [Colwellia echini]TYK64665.1 TonB-dependent siderophore receptor [Colwellia echini]
MKLTRAFALSSLVLAMGFPAYAQQNSSENTAENTAENTQNEAEKITIVGVRQDRVSKGATGFTMELNETPQSISVVSAEEIENYAAHSLNDALRLAPGINVEEWETNRTNYTSRGFEIKSTQIDGIGLPNDWGIVTGAMESYGYEEIEVIRGANGQLTGVGNSAGTINYVRKRPKNENAGEVQVSLGSFDFKRLEADYSVLLTESGSWAARFVVATEDSNSYLDGLSNDRTYFYGVVDGQLTDNSTLAAGYSYQDANTDGNMWGGLVFNYTDGTQAEWETSATTAQDWTMWDTINSTAFIEYAYIFNNDWELKATYNHQSFEDESKLFYASGAIDKDTGLGLNGWPGRYDTDYTADILDITTTGEFTLFDRSHELIFGASQAKSERAEYQHPFDYATTPAFGPTPAFPYALNVIEEPEWADRNEYSTTDITLTRVFGSAKLNASDDLFFIVGFNAIDFIRDGVNKTVASDGTVNAVDIYNKEKEISPYAGVTYTISEHVNAYLNYSDIYQPQDEYDEQGEFLAPTKGVNYEAGIKTQWLDNNLFANFAIFTAEQEGLANYAGSTPDGTWFYDGINVESQGFEVEVTGTIADNIGVLFSYTYLNIEGQDGEKEHQWAPKDSINFSIDYTFPQLETVKVGLGGLWQSKTVNTDYNVEQGAYAIVNAFARWDISEQFSVQANINNLTDTKYINSLYVVGYYGAPINGSISASYSF